MVSMSQATAPTPTAGESYEHYVIRAHRELSNLVTDPQRRNEIIWQTWRQSRGLTLAEEQAARAFPPSRFTMSRNHCEFGEHIATDANGERRDYDLAELAKIVRHANHRIADVGAFSALSDGHTPNPDDVNQDEPATLGYVGPYRLGMYGNVDQKWGIFADEHHLNEHVGELAKKPRRSVELWTFSNTGKSHFDPVAALGATAPRLALPAKFQTVDSRYGEATCEKYSCAAPAYPAGGSTFVTGFDEKPKPKYGGQEMDGQLAPEALSQIVAALGETPQFKFLTTLMNSPHAKQLCGAGGEPGANGGGQYDAAASLNNDPGASQGNETVPYGAPGAMPPNGAPPKPDVDGGAATSPDNGDDLSDLSDLLPPQEDDKHLGPLGAAIAGGAAAGMTQKNAAVPQSGYVQVERYKQLENAHTRLVHKYGQLNTAVVGMQRATTDAERKSRLHDLASSHPGMINVDEEAAVCLYSRGSTMTDADFTKHCETVTRFAARAEPMVASRLPVGEFPRESNGTAAGAKYAAALNDETVRIHTSLVDSGEFKDYDACEAEAKANLAARGIVAA